MPVLEVVDVGLEGRLLEIATVCEVLKVEGVGEELYKLQLQLKAQGRGSGADVEQLVVV